MEVLAVFECKRNPDDARRGFLRRRADLGWLAGESPRDASDDGDDDGSARRGYDPKRYVNRNHPTGHFVFGYHPVRRMERVFLTPVAGSDRVSDVIDADGDETEETRDANDGGWPSRRRNWSENRLVVTKASFRRFADGFANGGAGFYFPRLCLVTRPRAMCGLDTKVRAVIESSFESSFEKLREWPKDAAFARGFYRTSLFVFFFPRAPNRRTYLGALVEGPSGSSSVSASFIAPPRITRGTLRRTREALPSRVLLFRDPHAHARRGFFSP